MYSDGTCPTTVAEDGTVTRGACPDAYGKVLGMSCPAFLQLTPLTVTQ